MYPVLTHRALDQSELVMVTTRNSHFGSVTGAATSVMVWLMDREPDNRLDLHNASVDNDAANAHLCGTIDLRTGRTCVEPFHHRSPCRFVSKDEAQRMLRGVRQI